MNKSKTQKKINTDTGLRQCKSCNGIGTVDQPIRHMEHCQPKTQGKMIERFKKKFPSRNDCSNQTQKHLSNCQGCIKIIVEEDNDIEQFILKEQTALLQRVIELIGEDEKCPKSGEHKFGKYSSDSGVESYCEKCFINEAWVAGRKNIGKQLKTKISQMGEEIE